jgi:hypothetical protein
MVLRLDLQAAFVDSEIRVIKVVEYGWLLPLHSGTAGLSDGQGKREVALGERGTCL